MECCGYTLRMRAFLSWRFNIWLGRPRAHIKAQSETMNFMLLREDIKKKHFKPLPNDNNNNCRSIDYTGK